MSRFILIFACVLLLVPSGGFAQDSAALREQFFEEHVRPLLFEHCYACHGEKKQESALRLDSRASILRGGDSGAAAVVRKIDESLIVQAVRGEISQMPPDNPLDEKQIAVLERWIAIGLPWAAGDAPVAPSLGDQIAIRNVAKSHWAFQPVASPAPPLDPDADSANATASQSNSVIDAWIDRDLAAAGISTAPLANRRTLLRRLSFDITGLPPTAGEVRAFENDTMSGAVSRAVDRLLQSPHYGERWGRYWLDTARYADSQDWQAQTDIRYPFAYTYRDWVIGALNRDMPYNDFIRYQLAADSIESDPDSPQLAALGFLTVGPRFRGNKLEINADQIDVVSRGLMGLTVACARCHDHKYDPVPIEDYYSLYGVFASCNVPDEFPEISGASVGKAAQAGFRTELAQAEAKIEGYRQTLRREAIADLKKQIGVYFDGYYEMGVTGKVEIRGAISKYKFKETAMTPLNDQLSDLLRKGDIDDAVMGPWIQGLRLDEAMYAAEQSKLIAAWTADDSPLNPLVKAALAAAQPATRKSLIECYAELFQKVLDDPAGDEHADVIRSRMVDDGGLLDLQINLVVNASRLLGTGRKLLGDLDKGIIEVFATHPGAPPRAMVVSDAAEPVNPFVMLRGEPNRSGDRVPRQFVSVLSQGKPTPFTQGSGRLELANQIVAKSNPLTARVIVNRVWAKYFGRGLVENSDDFGLRCPPPTHPELLDWLAFNFIENDWSLKWLHRTIVLSQAYQRSSDASEDAMQLDPENRLLSHQNRRRLDIEAMRDAILATSDMLDPTFGGRSVPLTTPPYSQRRTVYAYVDRVDMDPMLKTFDIASPTASASERPITTIPQQALFLMNHPMVAEFARQTTTIVRRAGDDDAAINALYERLFQRSPSAGELAMALQFVSAPAVIDDSPDVVWRYGYGPTDRTGSEFTPLAHWAGDAYQPSDQFPDPVLRHVRLTAAGGNPMPTGEMAIIRRWTAPASGTVKILGKLEHARDNGDGIVGRVIDPAGGVLLERALFNGAESMDVDAVTVERGQTIEFIVHCNQNPAADQFTWAPQLVGIGGELDGVEFSATRDFAGPPPPKLSAWEQLAQALMLTNEFHFLD